MRFDASSAAADCWLLLDTGCRWLQSGGRFFFPLICSCVRNAPHLREPGDRIQQCVCAAADRREDSSYGRQLIRADTPPQRFGRLGADLGDQTRASLTEPRHHLTKARKRVDSDDASRAAVQQWRAVAGTQITSLSWCRSVTAAAPASSSTVTSFSSAAICPCRRRIAPAVACGSTTRESTDRYGWLSLKKGKAAGTSTGREHISPAQDLS